MNKQDIIEFFDRLAPHWDADMIKSDRIIETILDGAEVTAGKTVLDVACGTGVMIPYYLSRGALVTGIDIAPRMVELAREKFPKVPILCGDVETAEFPEKFDCIVIYNAFPHFPRPERLIRLLASQLKPGGTLTVAHGMSRAHIDSHHKGAAGKVSIGLMHEDDLAALMGQHLQVTVKLSTDTMYQVTAKRRAVPAEAVHSSEC